MLACSEAPEQGACQAAEVAAPPAPTSAAAAAEQHAATAAMGAARRRSSLPPLCEACGHANEKRKDAAIGLFALALLFVMAWAARGSASGAGSVNRSRRSLPDGLYDTAAPLALVTSVVPTAAHATASLDASAAGGAAAAAAAAADTAAPSLDGGSGPDGASQGPLELPQPPRPRVYLSWSLRYGLSNQLYRWAPEKAELARGCGCGPQQALQPSSEPLQPSLTRTTAAPAPCSHANGLALALLLGVDGAILPPAVCRRTFNVSLSQLASEDLWAPRPLSTLLDLHRMKEHWRQEHGIQLQEARVLWMGVVRWGRCQRGGLLRLCRGSRFIPATERPPALCALQAAAVRMTSEGAAYPRPLLDSARPQGEPADCAVLPLHVAEFGSLVRVAAAARALVDGARQAVGPNGCIILRTESLFRGFYYNG